METGTNEHPARLKVGIVGPGRAGTALGRALVRAGHEVVAAAAVSEQSKLRVSDHFPRAKITDPAGVLGAADLVLITVPDDVLPGLVEGLAATDAPYAGRLIAHASGAHGIRVLDPATRAGALPLALHPVMTFTGREDDVDRIKGVSFGVTAPDQLRPAAEALVIEMGGEPVFIAEENRALRRDPAAPRLDRARRGHDRRVARLRPARRTAAADPERLRLRRRHRRLRGPARLAARRNPRRQRPGPGRAADVIDPDLLAVHHRRRPAPHPAPPSRAGHRRRRRGEDGVTARARARGRRQDW